MNQKNNSSDNIIYNTPDGKSVVSLYAKDGSVWMNQAQLAELFNTTKTNISLHIRNIINENELDEISVVKDYLTTASDATGRPNNNEFIEIDKELSKFIAHINKTEL